VKKIEKTDRFGFISLKLKKLNPTQTKKTRKKTIQTEKNRAKPEKTSQTSLNRFLS
jgi:hypothetical protein